MGGAFIFMYLIKTGKTSLATFDEIISVYSNLDKLSTTIAILLFLSKCISLPFIIISGKSVNPYELFL